MAQATGVPGATEFPHHVLVVDDEAGVRELIADFFVRQGIQVAVAADGREAIEMVAQSGGRYGLIVTDLDLPGADGLQVLDAARRLSPASFVVIVTGYASLDSAIRAVRMGAYDYLPKPFSLGQLDLILRRIRDLAALTSRSPVVRTTAGRLGSDAELQGSDPNLPAVGRTRSTTEDPVAQRLNNIETLLRSIDSTLGAIAAHIEDERADRVTSGRR